MDTGILTNLLKEFLDVFTLGYNRLLPDARQLLWLLATIEITLAGMWWAFDGGEKIEKALLVKIMQLGFFIWVVSNYRFIIETVLLGFVSTGTKAGGNNNFTLLEDPSSIVDYGFAATDPIFFHLKHHYFSASLPDLVLSGIAGLLILLAYFALAAAAFITYLEFYIVSVLGLILIPFGVFKHTSFLSEKVFGTVISFGIRLMVLAFILAVVEPTLRKMTLPVNPTLAQIFTVFLAAFTIAVLAWHAPGIASGMMAGSPTLGVGTMLSTGLAAGAGIIGVGAIGGAGYIASRAKKGLGQVAAAARAGLSQRFFPRNGGGGGNGHLGSRSFGAGVGLSPSSAGATGGNSSKGGGSAMAASNGAKAASAKTNSTGMPVWAQNLMLVQHAIPHDSHSGTGVSVPVKHE